MVLEDKGRSRVQALGTRHYVLYPHFVETLETRPVVFKTIRLSGRSDPAQFIKIVHNNLEDLGVQVSFLRQAAE